MGYELNVFTGQLDLVNSSAGTVTSVGLTLPGIFNVTGSPVTTSGTIVATLAPENANTVFAGPSSGGPATPTFRDLVSADIPDLSALYVTQTEVGVANGVASLDSSGKIPASELPSTLLQYQGLWNPSTNTPTLQDSTGTNGFVYQVSAAFAGPISGLNNSTMVNFQVGNLVIYSSSIGQWEQTTPAAGVVSVNGAQGVVTVNAINQLTGDVTAGPSSGSQSEVSSLVATSNSTLTTLSALTTASNLSSVGTITSGTWNGTAIAVTHGGTGLTTLTPGNVILGNGTSSPTFVAPGSSGNVLTSNGSTWTSAAVTIGANTSLSNLVSTTAINSALTFGTGVGGELITPNVTGTATAEFINILPGTAVNGPGGAINLTAGATSGIGNGGNIILTSGHATGTGSAGQVDILGGGASGTSSVGGIINIQAGNASGGLGEGGNINITTGTGNQPGSLLLFTDGQVSINSFSGNNSIPLQFFDAAGDNFSALVAANTLTSSTTWTLPLADGTSNQVLTTDGAGTLSWSTVGIGSVTSVAFSDASTIPIYSVSGSPVTSTGTLTVTLEAQTANTVFSGPISGSAAQPTFRLLVSADIPNNTANTTGTASNITATSNSTLTTLSSLSLPGSQVTGNISGNAANITGTVAVANGGTGLGTLTANNVILGNGTSSPLFVAPSTSGNVLTSNGTTWVSSALPATGANTSLSNLSAVAVNTDLLPASSFSSNIGSQALPWNQLYTALVAAIPDTTGNVFSRLSQTNAGGQNPLGFTVNGLSVLGTPGAFYTLNSSAADSVATESIYIATGNKSAGTGNSGNIVLQPGTSSGGTPGTINLADASLSGSSTGYTWALKNTTTGQGGWTVNTPVFSGLTTNAPVYATSSSAVASLSSAGTSGQVLTSNGSGSAPSYQNAATTPSVILQSTTLNPAAMNTVYVLSGASFTITLPTAVGATGFVTFKHTGTSLTQAYTLDTTSSQTIGGVVGGSYVLHTNQESLTLFSDGSNWQIYDHTTSTGEVSAGTTTITGTTTNPSKATTPTVDTVIWWRTGNRARIRMTYKHTSSTGTAAGSGDYLFLLPMTVDTTNIVAFSTVSTNAAQISSNEVGAAYISNNGSGYADQPVVVFDSTHVRAGFGTSATNFVGNGNGTITATNIVYLLDIDIPVSGWQP